MSKYAQTWSKVRIAKDTQRTLEEGQWQVDGVLIENGEFRGCTEYVDYWHTQEGALKYGVYAFVDTMRRLGIERSRNDRTELSQRP